MPQYNPTLEFARTALVFVIALYIAFYLVHVVTFNKALRARDENIIITKGDPYPSWFLIGRRYIDFSLVIMSTAAVMLIVVNIPIVLGTVGVPRTSAPNALIVTIGLVISLASFALACMFMGLGSKYGKLLTATMAVDYACITLATAALTFNSFVSTGFFSS